MMILMIQLILSLISMSKAEMQKVDLDFDPHNVLSTVNPHFASFTMDASGWRSFDLGGVDDPSTGRYGATLDLLVSQFENATLRVGGTQQDYDVYVDFGAVNQTCENLEPPMTTYRCRTMDKEQWNELLNFSHRNGLRLVFGLNDMFGRPTKTLKPENATCNETACPERNQSNLESLIEYTFREKPTGWDSIQGFELGNELNKVLNDAIGASTQAQDFIQLRKNIVPSSVQVYGPDTHSYTQYSQSGRDWISNFSKTAADSIDAFTFHQYCMGSGPSLDPTRLNASFLNHTALEKCLQGAQYVDDLNLITLSYPSIPLKHRYIIQSASGQDVVIAGETAAANNGGQSGITDTYIDGFWFLYQLGVFARLGVSQHYRQCFFSFLGISSRGGKNIRGLDHHRRILRDEISKVYS